MLFNIYLLELDKYINTHIISYLEELNVKQGLAHANSDETNSTPTNKRFRQLTKRTSQLRDRIAFVRNLLKLRYKDTNSDNKAPTKAPHPRYWKAWYTSQNSKTLRAMLISLIKRLKVIRHKKLHINSYTDNKRMLRLKYYRYADDWVVLCNCDKQVANTIKEKIAKFLFEELGLTLSERKTLITDIRRSPAHFLGFELRRMQEGRLKKMYTSSTSPISVRPLRAGQHLRNTRKKLQRASGLLVCALPDKQRLLNRYYMKGLCTQTGFPREVFWLSTFDATVIIERYNQMIRGLANHYAEYISWPSKIGRWVYILRYSCLKTLAQKYRTSIKGIFKKFGHNMYSRSTQTIKVTERIVDKRNMKAYEKDKILLTYTEALKQALSLNLKEHYLKIHLDKKQGIIGEYDIKTGQFPRITHKDFLDSFTWVSWRTQAQADLPCAQCGSTENVEMHHKKHVRKNNYSSIPPFLSVEQMQHLRNRKQVPLCESCHKALHKGIYSGQSISKMSVKRVNYTADPNWEKNKGSVLMSVEGKDGNNVLISRNKLVDNRIVHIETFIHPGQTVYSKTMEEKGWTVIPLDLDQVKRKKG